MNLPPEDNLRKEDKSSAPKVSFIRRFHCINITTCYVEAIHAVNAVLWHTGEQNQTTNQKIHVQCTDYYNNYNPRHTNHSYADTMLVHYFIASQDEN